jgi:predicted permease
MHLYQNAVSFTATFALLVCIILLLRARGVVSNSDAPLIARLTLDFVLPALLMSKLSSAHLDHEVLKVSFYIFLAESVVGVLSFFIGKYALRLPRSSLAPFILCSTFGSTAILGTAFLTSIFEADTQSVAFGLLVSQLSVGIPAYFVLPAVSLYFSDKQAIFDPLSMIKHILLSPPIIAISVGIFWSLSKAPTSGTFLTPIFNALNFASSALVFMVALLNALALEPFSLKSHGLSILFCAFLALLLEPMLVYWMESYSQISLRDMQISFILAAMPAANAVIAYSIRYQTDAKLAAVLVTSTAVLDCLVIPSIMPFFSIFK